MLGLVVFLATSQAGNEGWYVYGVGLQCELAHSVV